MCGRFAVTTDPALLAVKIDAIDERAVEEAGVPNFNVAPTTAITTLVSRHGEPEDDATRRLRLMHWGLVPPWVKAAPDGTPENKGPLLINARAEKVTISPAFRSAAKSKRCLVPMDGYYEWKPNPDAPSGKKAPKTPYYIYRADGQPLFMAGLWSVWRADNASPLLSCAIITTDAVGGLSAIHDRMPLVVQQQDWDRWLDPDEPTVIDLLATPPDVRGIAMRAVSTLVNSVRNNGPELIEPSAPYDGAAQSVGNHEGGGNGRG